MLLANVFAILHGRSSIIFIAAFIQFMWMYYIVQQFQVIHHVVHTTYIHRFRFAHEYFISTGRRIGFFLSVITVTQTMIPMIDVLDISLRNNISKYHLMLSNTHTVNFFMCTKGCKRKYSFTTFSRIYVPWFIDKVVTFTTKVALFDRGRAPTCNVCNQERGRYNMYIHKCSFTSCNCRILNNAINLGCFRWIVHLLFIFLVDKLVKLILRGTKRTKLRQWSFMSF